MPRLPYLPADLAEPGPIIDAIRARRGGRLMHLDRQLLHSPPVAQGWNAFLGAMRRDLKLAPRLRELAMCAVAIVNDAHYEFVHHAPLFIEAGASEAQAHALRDIDAAAADHTLFDELDRAVLAFTIESTRHVKVTDATFARARELLGSDRLMFELIATVAAYNMVSRVLVAVGIEPEGED